VGFSTPLRFTMAKPVDAPGMIMKERVGKVVTQRTALMKQLSDAIRGNTAEVARRKTAAVHLQAVAAAEVFREWEGGGGGRQVGCVRTFQCTTLSPRLPHGLPWPRSGFEDSVGRDGGVHAEQRRCAVQGARGRGGGGTPAAAIPRRMRSHARGAPLDKRMVHARQRTLSQRTHAAVTMRVHAMVAIGWMTVRAACVCATLGGAPRQWHAVHVCGR
jgi:hypothetical protein